MGYPGCFGNIFGLAKTREIDNNTTRNTVSSTREVFMVHLLGEWGRKQQGSRRHGTAGSERKGRGRKGAGLK